MLESIDWMYSGLVAGWFWVVVGGMDFCWITCAAELYTVMLSAWDRPNVHVQHLRAPAMLPVSVISC
jgi:hypothetical protein